VCTIPSQQVLQILVEDVAKQLLENTLLLSANSGTLTISLAPTVAQAFVETFMRLTARELARTVQRTCIVAPDVDKQSLENTMSAMERCCIPSVSTRTAVQDVERESPLHQWSHLRDIGTLSASLVQIATQNLAPASTTRMANHTVAIVLDNEELEQSTATSALNHSLEHMLPMKEEVITVDVSPATCATLCCLMSLSSLSMDRLLARTVQTNEINRPSFCSVLLS